MFPLNLEIIKYASWMKELLVKAKVSLWQSKLFCTEDRIAFIVSPQRSYYHMKFMFVVWSHVKKSSQRYKRGCMHVCLEAEAECRCVLAAFHNKWRQDISTYCRQPLGTGSPRASALCVCSKVASSSLKPQVMGDICLIYHRGTSALAASVQV